jgi:hypothetical protein
MNKPVSILILLLALALQVQAQAIRSIGIKAGPSLARQTFERVESNQEVISDTWNQTKGASAALSIEWLNLENVSVVTDLGFAQKGSANSATQFLTDIPGLNTSDMQSNYAYVQGLLKVRVPIGLVSPYLAAGPRGDFFLDQNSGSNLDDDNFTPFIAGATFAAGLELRLLRVSLLAEAQYHLDFKDAYTFIEEEPNAPRIENTLRNRAVLLQAGLVFHLKD